MKRILFCVVALSFFVHGVQAAEINTTAGSKALLFGFNGLANLGLNAYNGGFGARYYISDGMAVRPGVTLGYSSATTKGGTGFSDLVSSNSNLGLNVVVEKHLQGPKSISPYVGGGLGFSLNSNTTEFSLPVVPDVGDLLKQTTSGTDFRLFLVVGFEWGLTESLTLGGEYSAGLGFGSSSRESERQSEPTVKDNEISNMSLGLGVASVFLAVSI
jgi:opacity protein-like surface antigen